MRNKAAIILGPIIGGLSHARVNLWARANSPATLYAWLATRKDLGNVKRAGMAKLTDSTGFAGIIPIEKLKPETTYYFALSLDPRLRPPKQVFRSFKTFPLPRQPKSFRFAFGSCFRPDKTLAGGAFQHINNKDEDLSFMIMAGDQIYADAFEFNGLGRVALNLDDYRAVYRNSWQNEHIRELMSRTPLFMTQDDHEVDDDWRWLDFEYQQPAIPFYVSLTRWFQGRNREERSLTKERARAALQAYHEHQVLHAPPLLSTDGARAYTFEYGACAFFVTDTRSRRVITKQGRSMLGESQFNGLTGWLKRVNDEYPIKFIVTATSILSHVYLDPTNDRWSGFKIERDRLLRFIAAEGIKGVYFLTGDLHTAHAISAQAVDKDGPPVPVWEFCASPFEQKPFWRALFFDRPARSPALQKQERHFVVPHINYGLVEVEFSASTRPVVHFQVVYREGDEWKRQFVNSTA